MTMPGSRAHDRVRLPGLFFCGDRGAAFFYRRRADCSDAAPSAPPGVAVAFRGDRAIAPLA